MKPELQCRYHDVEETRALRPQPMKAARKCAITLREEELYIAGSQDRGAETFKAFGTKAQILCTGHRTLRFEFIPVDFSLILVQYYSSISPFIQFVMRMCMLCCCMLDMSNVQFYKGHSLYVIMSYMLII